MRTDRYEGEWSFGQNQAIAKALKPRKDPHFLLKLTTVVSVACIIGYCAPAHTEGVQLTPSITRDFTPEGLRQYAQSISPDHVFSKMVVEPVTTGENYAGSSYVFINGTPFLVRLYWPEEADVHLQYPWLTYPPVVPPCNFPQPTIC